MALSFSQLYWLARSVGLSHEDARVAAAIAMAESSGRPEAIGDRGTSVGLWQIHLPAHPWAKGMNLQDPYQNALAMARISQGGKNWKPWTTYRTGAYMRYMGADVSGPESLGALTGPAQTTYGVVDRPVRQMVIPTGRASSGEAELRAKLDTGSSAPALEAKPLVPVLVKQGVREVYGQSTLGVPQGAAAIPQAKGFEGLHPEFARRLAGLLQEVPELKITSGYRSVQEQAVLWEKYGRNPRRVAPPGRSKHNYGLAADISGPPQAMQKAHQLAAKYGLVFPMSWEPWHIELQGASALMSGQASSAPPPPKPAFFYSRTYLPFKPLVQPTAPPRYDLALAQLRDLGLLSV